MSAPTAIAVTTDSREYSRYEDNLSIITTTVDATGGGPYAGELVYVDLVKARRARTSVVSSQTLTLSGPDPFVTDVQFDLRNIVDSSQINKVRHGRYVIRATYPGTFASASMGSGANGTVTITSLDAGLAGNATTIQVVVPGGTSGLNTTIAGSTITVLLAVNAGVPVVAENTALLVANMINSRLIGSFFSVSSGNGTGVFSAPISPVTFAGGTDIVTTDSAEFTVRIVSIHRMKSEYMFGLSLKATDIKMVKYQPSAITGVEVIEVSNNSPVGFANLSYTVTQPTPGVFIRSLAWNGAARMEPRLPASQC